MTNQEALKLLNDMEFAEKYQGKQEYADMLLLCKKSLEKQIPKKAKKSDREIRYCEVFECPSCGFEFSGRVAKYCYRCGQKLDYSEVK